MTEVRASGKVAADEMAERESATLDEPTGPAEQVAGRGIELNLNGGPVTRPEDVHTSLTPGFSRMRTDWNGPDREVIEQMRKGVDVMIQHHFADVFLIFYDINRVVRVQKANADTGELVTDHLGLPVWELDPVTEKPIENWRQLDAEQRSTFIYRITTGMFRWEQRAADLWAEAMFARAAFEEAFSHGYEELPGTSKPTIDDRTARARVRAAEHRYFAVYASYLSRRADAVVRSAERTNQRLKDLTV